MRKKREVRVKFERSIRYTERLVPYTATTAGNEKNEKEKKKAYLG